VQGLVHSSSSDPLVFWKHSKTKSA